jgi:Domain of unknown function (DUF1854)
MPVFATELSAMRDEPAPILDTVSADGAGVRLYVDPWARLVLNTPDGAFHVGVDPIRAFPITDPTSWISFCDPEGREIYCLETTNGLTADARRVLDEELSRREFLPLIHRILRVSGEATPADWDVETDRGPTRFTLDSEDDIRRLGPYRLLITDSRKLHYQVADIRALDASSRRLLERFL